MKKNITTKFQDFKDKEVQDFNKSKEYKPLSDDILAMSKLDTGEYEPIEGEISIVQVLGIVDDPTEIKNIEKSIKENFTIDTSLNLKNVKRGEILWITALLQKDNKSQSLNSQTLGVVKVRVVDYFYGLNKLNQIKKQNN